MNYLFLFIFSASIFSVKTVKAETEKYGYRVTSPEKTVIQIARDVYNDERLWKKIAFYNNIKPPYSLTVGQVLVLPLAPVNQLAKENLAVGNEVPPPSFLAKRPSVEQKILKDAKYYVYIVNERAPSLSMVAIENYGNKKMSSVIAKWNGLAKDAKLSLGQNLKLKLRPTLHAAEATALLVSHWAKLGNADMVMRLGGSDQLVQQIKAAKAVHTKSTLPAAPTPSMAAPTPSMAAPTPSMAAPTPSMAAPTPSMAAPTPSVVNPVNDPEVSAAETEKLRTPTSDSPNIEKPADYKEPTTENYWLDEETINKLNSLQKTKTEKFIK